MNSHWYSNTTWFILSFPSCLSTDSHSNHKKHGSSHPSPIYSIFQSQYTSIAISELLTHTPMGNNQNWVKCFSMVPFVFSLGVQSNYHFPRLFRSACLLLTPFSEVMSYICNTVSLCYCSLYSILGFPDFLANFF